MAELSLPAKIQFLDANGDPLVGGKVYTYEAGTTTPKATYIDQLETTPNTNPIILDSRGEAVIRLAAGSYKYKVDDADDVNIYTVDNVNNTTGSLTDPDITTGATLLNNAYIELRESTVNGTNYLRIKGAESIASNKTLSFPDDLGSVADITTLTSATTLTTANHMILGDTSSAAFTITLPTAVGNTGKRFIIKYSDSNTTNSLTIDGNGSETIDGSTTQTLDIENEEMTIVSDGSNWQILDHYIPRILVTGANNGGTSLTANTTNIDWTEVSDTLSIYNGTQTTIPKTGVYRVNAFVVGSGGFPGNPVFSLYIGGSAHQYCGYIAANNAVQPILWSGLLTKGNVVSIRVDQTHTLSASAQHWFTLQRVS